MSLLDLKEHVESVFFVLGEMSRQSANVHGALVVLDHLQTAGRVRTRLRVVVVLHRRRQSRQKVQHGLVINLHVRDPTSTYARFCE